MAHDQPQEKRHIDYSRTVLANERLTQTTAMQSKKSEIYSNDLFEITESFLSQIKGIERKLSADLVVNKGLFVMVTASGSGHISGDLKKNHA